MTWFSSCHRPGSFCFAGVRFTRSLMGLRSVSVRSLSYIEGSTKENLFEDLEDGGPAYSNVNCRIWRCFMMNDYLCGPRLLLPSCSKEPCCKWQWKIKMASAFAGVVGDVGFVKLNRASIKVTIERRPHRLGVS